MRTIGHACKSLLSFVLLSILTLAPLGRVSAASSDSLYTFDFANATGIIANSAASNSTANLTLLGPWTSDATGTTFTGNLTDTQTSSYAKPTSGPTISIPVTQTVGAAAIFMYPGGCNSDSQNISQIGFFASGASQVKLQLSKCANGITYPECRIAGALTPSNTTAVRGTTKLIAGRTYRNECVKSADSKGKATVTMRTTLIDTTTGNTTVTNTASIPATGNISSTQYVSAGNKYPLVAQSNNTDQFTGKIAKLSYCKGVDVLTAQTCLTSEVPLPAIIPPAPAPVAKVAPASVSTQAVTALAAAPVDEVKYSYGNTPDEIVFDWRGSETKIYYGLDSSYGSEATATPSAITPTDIAGPFMEVRITGLQPGAKYHYKIGLDGQDYVFSAAPSNTDSFKAVALGDTIASSCRTYQAQSNLQIAGINPDFVIHSGDMAIANECGNSATHQYYLDIQNTFSRQAAFMPVWGNHEYGSPTADSPSGTVRDSLANYKGRSAVAHPQTVPNDTTKQTSHPGCSNTGGTTNTCMGEDWGWFRAGRVVFISVPEVWPNAITDWRTKAGAIMETAQNDPTVDFIVTYGHRPVLSSTTYTAPTGYDAAFTQLGDLYSPTARADGKYVLNMTGHRHNMEAFDSYHGVTQVVNGGGGQGLINFGTILASSSFHMKHLGISTIAYDANSRQLTYQIACGQSTSGETTTCSPNTVMYTKTFTSTNVPPVPTPAQLHLSLDDGATSRQPGETFTYSIALENSGDQSAAASTLNSVLPANLTLINAAGATVDGQNLSWAVPDLAGHSSATFALTVVLNPAAVASDQVLVSAAMTVTDTACDTGAQCTAQDLNSVYVAPPIPVFTEYVTNPGVETNLTGWTGKYNGSTAVTVTRSTEAAHSGVASIKVLGLSGASNLNSGFNDSPYVVPTVTLGKTYTGTVWVKPAVSGQQIVLRLREWNGSTIVTDNKNTYTTVGTGWQQVTTTITPVQSGTRLAFVVYGNDIDAGEYFYADDLSLTTPN